MKTDYLKGLPELEIVIMAKNGDKNAAELLWEKYRKPMANVFGLPMTAKERESEAAVVFMCCIKSINTEKEENRREGWKFFSYLYFCMISRRAKLRRKRVDLSYDESENELESGSNMLNAETVCLFNKELFSRYDPVEPVLELAVKEKARQIGDSIDRLQKIRMDYSRYVRDMFRGNRQ
jgi:hypothetical protein